MNVPYKEKEEAKQLECKWDPNRKSWFITVENPNYRFVIEKYGKNAYKIVNDKKVLLTDIPKGMEEFYLLPPTDIRKIMITSITNKKIGFLKEK